MKESIANHLASDPVYGATPSYLAGLHRYLEGEEAARADDLLSIADVAVPRLERRDQELAGERSERQAAKVRALNRFTQRKEERVAPHFDAAAPKNATRIVTIRLRTMIK